jgi:hypothetical protein
MAKERVGYRRLYDAIGCALGDREELWIKFPLNNLEMWAYLGPKPKFGITITNSGKYIVPGEVSLIAASEYKKDASESSHPRQFFTEISCFMPVDVSDEISRAFHAKEVKGHDPLLALAEQKAAQLKSACDLIAGTIGLRFHRQFVLEVLNENFVALRSETDFAHNHASASVEVLEDLTLNPTGVSIMQSFLGDVGRAAPEAAEFGASAMAWLLRSWAERDVISKFMSLFIPIEIILAGYGDTHANLERKEYLSTAIRSLLSTHGGAEGPDLIEFLDRMMAQQRPSLASRFEQMATEAQIDGWQSDIAAFRRFNSIRNKLLHRGDRRVQLSISLGDEFEQETRELEDLAERYVSWALFRTGEVYRSQWRPSRIKKATPE